jgi:hypothetical protein
VPKEEVYLSGRFVNFFIIYFYIKGSELQKKTLNRKDMILENSQSTIIVNPERTLNDFQIEEEVENIVKK